MVSERCGLIKLPDWDGIDACRARRAGKPRWVDMTTQEAGAFRREMINRISGSFRPDVIIVDYLPFGQRRELDDILSADHALKYFLHRGLSDRADSDLLRGAATRQIADRYDRILVASDPRLGNIAEEDEYCEDAIGKLSYVGFIAPRPLKDPEDWTPTVVCSGGGGRGSEALILACVDVATNNPTIPFKVILGPRSALSTTNIAPPKNCNVIAISEDLPILHQQAAVVVSTGGYNSVIESAIGGAHIIVFPNQVGDNDEQRRFADRIAQHHPLDRLTGLDQLEHMVLTSWQAAQGKVRNRINLQANGADRVAALIERDLGSGRGRPVRS